MKADRWKNIKKIFNQAAEMSALERSEFVATECAGDSEMRVEIEKMLVFADDTGDELENNAFDFLAERKTNKFPERINNYRIIREIGRGGMGAVFEAVRETRNFKQRAALKIIKRGMDTDAILSRFRHEQKILASLEHPFIARFLDGGMTEDGLPFYAMEYIEGRFIDDYCREENLTIEQRLELFRQVCSAVQYAHQNLVIHRDLKPKNILVTGEGTPKLLDFGIGKILTPETADEIGTATQFGMMTPAYASPEQIRGRRIGTTSDVYSLGVILYELLTGQKPYKISSASQVEIERVVLETEPPRPSSVVARPPFFSGKPKTNSGAPQTKDSKLRAKPKALRGDLDNIILKALDKIPENRYASVGQFSADIQRYLEGLPVVARPHTFSYRAAKFFRRNRVPVVAAFLIVLSLCAGIVIALWQANEARQAKLRAEKRFGEVRQLANNVVFKYHDAIADLQGATSVREMLVKDALEYLDKLSKEAGDDHVLQKELARAYLKLGDVQGKMYSANIGDSEGAVKSYEKSLALLEEVARKQPADVEAKENLIQAYDNLAFLKLRTGNHYDSKELVNKALALYDEISRIEPDNDKRTLQLIELFIRLGDVDVGGENERATGEQNFSIRLNHHLKALPLIENLIRSDENNPVFVRTLSRVYQRIGSDYFWLGDQSERHGEHEKSVEFYNQALTFHQKMFEAAENLFRLEPESTTSRRYRAVAHLALAETLGRNQRSDEALPLAEKARLMYEEMLRRDTKNQETKFDQSEVYRVFSSIYLSRKDFEKAVGFMQKKLSVAEEIYRTDGKNLEVAQRICETYRTLAKIHDLKGDAEKADFNRRKAEVWTKVISRN